MHWTSTTVLRKGHRCITWQLAFTNHHLRSYGWQCPCLMDPLSFGIWLTYSHLLLLVVSTSCNISSLANLSHSFLVGACHTINTWKRGKFGCKLSALLGNLPCPNFTPIAVICTIGLMFREMYIYNLAYNNKSNSAHHSGCDGILANSYIEDDEVCMGGFTQGGLCKGKMSWLAVCQSQ